MLQHGGRRGDKEWLFAETAGATIAHASPLPVTHFKLSLYTHHELGLGRLRATILREDSASAAAPPTVIDPCCPAPGCVGAPKGQGLYREFRVPRENSLPAGQYTLRLEVVAQPAGLCARGGSQVSLRRVAGLRDASDSGAAPAVGTRGGQQQPGGQRLIKSSLEAMRTDGPLPPLAPRPPLAPPSFFFYSLYN